MNIIDLFSGAGGFSYGFQKAGYNIIASNDIWQDAINTINYNHGKEIGHNLPISEFNDTILPTILRDNNVDGVIGGPPCQGFSMVGTRKENDERNNLYLEYVRTVELTNPQFFVLENVPGLLSMSEGYFKKDIINRFTKLGYNVTYKVLTASDYGVPQARKRVFFIGIRKSLGIGEFDFEVFHERYKENMVTCQEAISDLPSYEKMERYISKPLNTFQSEMRKNSGSIVLNNEITNHQQKTIDIISMVPDGGSIKDLSEEYYKVRNYSAAFKRMKSDGVSSTIDCGHRNYFHYKFNRVPTVRESARIQTFPDDYLFTGSKTSQYTQVGNAVPSKLSYKIASAIKTLLNS